MDEFSTASIWEMIHHILEVMGIVFIPFVGWVMVTLTNHSKQIIILEEKVNDSLNRRMSSLEDRVVGMEERLETKIDTIEKNVVECKLTITEKAGALTQVLDKLDTVIKNVGR